VQSVTDRREVEHWWLELDRYDIDIAALSETRLADQGQLIEKGVGYTFYLKRRPSTEPRQSGVGFAIRNSLVSKLLIFLEASATV
jgi:hypothetical protein